MTTTLERPQRLPRGGAPRRPARWWAQWRVALRLARRDAWRSKGRSLLVVLLIALPVAVVTGVYVFGVAQAGQSGDRNRIAALVGTNADAVVFPIGGHVLQAPNGNLGSADGSTQIAGDSKYPATATPPSAAQLLAALPPGSRLVSSGSAINSIVENGDWGVAATVAVSDVTDPLPAGLWDVVSGTLPSSAGEVALTRSTARRLHASIGDSVRVTQTDGHGVATLRVVGLVLPVAPGWSAAGGGVALPANFPGADVSAPSEGYLAATPRPLTWADVRAVNAAGGSVETLGLYDNPPSFCRVDQICLDDHGMSSPAPDPQPQTDQQLAEIARKAAEAAVLLVLVVLQIALLAGPAFAVQLRRRQRELGLVSASGGPASVLRRTMLASGVVLGLAGAAFGLLVGYGVVWLLGGVLPWAPLSDVFGARMGLPPFPIEVLAFALVGAISAVAAATVPAFTAGRGDVIEALKGQRPSPRIRRRTPITGVAMAGLGLAITAYGVAQTDAIVLGVGVIVGELGLVLLMPSFVVALGRPAARLPVSLRIAVRDSGRHRMRTAAAACAVMAAAAAAVATSAWTMSAAQLNGNAERALPEGIVVAQGSVGTDENGHATETVEHVATVMRAAVVAAMPGAAALPVSAAVPAGSTTMGSGGSMVCVSWPTWTSTHVSSSGVALDQPCTGRTTAGGSVLQPVMVLGDVDRLDVLLGSLAPLDSAKAALRSGKALVLTPHTLDPQGRVWLQATAWDNPQVPAPVAVPGFEVLAGTLPAQVILGPVALQSATLRSTVTTDPFSTYLLVSPLTADTPDSPTAADRVALALVRAGVGGGVLETGASADPALVTMAIGSAATLLLALLAGLMVSALALADGRADLQTLAAVGGPPRVRRRFAASSAGFVTGLGTLVGTVSGLVVAWVLLPLFGSTSVSGQLSRGPFVVPWATVALVVLAVPVVTSAVAWATTRSRIALTRRPD